MHGCAYPKVEIVLPGGKTFAIRTKGTGDVVKSVTLNGKPHDPLFLRHSEIVFGGELVFELCDGRQEGTCGSRAEMRQANFGIGIGNTTRRTGR
jgi:putative alpha-1,2-mannosidase